MCYDESVLLLLSHFSCVRLCDPIDGSPPGPSIPGILQARIVECIAFFQEIFPTQGSNQHLLCLLWVLYH